MTRVLVAAAIAAASLALCGSAQAACPVWATPQEAMEFNIAKRPLDSANVVGADDECWCPVVTYTHDAALLHDTPSVFRKRIEWLCNVGQMFSTRQEAEAYVSSGAITGLWEPEAPEPRGAWIPKEAFKSIGFVQIVHPERATK